VICLLSLYIVYFSFSTVAAYTANKVCIYFITHQCSVLLLRRQPYWRSRRGYCRRMSTPRVCICLSRKKGNYFLL